MNQIVMMWLRSTTLLNQIHLLQLLRYNFQKDFVN